MNATVSGDASLQTIVVAGLLRCAIALNKAGDASELYQYLRSAVTGTSAAAVENTKRKAPPPRPANVDKRIAGALDAFDLFDAHAKLDRADTDPMHQQLISALDAWSSVIGITFTLSVENRVDVFFR